MNRSIEQTLTNLIPRYNGTLPPELIELASSLLAQSRNQASNLKADEEIGRTYTCAHIACERLKRTLNLPKIEPQPPCAPRVYDKLYAYFDRVLVDRKLMRPSNISSQNTPNKPLPSRSTPTKASSLAPFKPTPSRGPSSRKRGLQYAGSKEIHHWIHPTIRALCKELGAPAAAPAILAGVTTVLILPFPSVEDNEAVSSHPKDKIPALIAAVYFFVVTRLVGRETSEEEYGKGRKKALEALRMIRMDKALNEKLLAKSTTGTVWEGWEDVKPKQVDTWLLELSTKGWLQLDWFTNVNEGSGIDITDHVEEHGQADQDEIEVGSDKDTLQAGLGTMMQDRVDYLSDKNRSEYRSWSLEIVARIEQREAAIAIEDMDTAEG